MPLRVFAIALGLAALAACATQESKPQREPSAAKAAARTPAPDLRRRPGQESVPAAAAAAADPNRASGLAPVPPAKPWTETEKVPVPDRWRILNTLGVVPQRWYDPYNQNTLKADKPVFGDDWFLNVATIADLIYEPRRLPAPVGAQASARPGQHDIFGEPEQTLSNGNLILSLVLLQGDTTFRPPDLEFRLTPVLNANYTESEEVRLLNVDPRRGENRRDDFVGLQEAFADVHLRNVSERYDFDSFRIGIQPFSSDFRGFLFQDNQLMARLFGTRANNRVQYNLAWIRRLEKDTNSGLNDVSEDLREDDFYIANLYWQDFPSQGFTSQALLAYNDNRETGRFYDRNGFLARPASFGLEQPREYRVGYVGYNGDGHFGRLNLTVSAYGAFGQEDQGVFTGRPRDIAAGFGAAEASIDQDWIRWRLSLLYASGDGDPFDDEANGFDAVFENPIFAGADTSFWIRQSVPLIGGGIVGLSTRNGLLNNLRHSKEHGQSNFANPGIGLAGLGADFDLTPTLRLSTNFNYLQFADTAVLEAARNQAPIDQAIGWDLSVAAIWRPFMQQNVVLRLSGAGLLPDDGFKDLYPDQDAYSVLANLILTY